MRARILRRAVKIKINTMRDGKRAAQGHIKGSLRNAKGPVETDDSKSVSWPIYSMILLCPTVLSSLHIGADDGGVAVSWTCEESRLEESDKTVGK